MKRIVFFPLLAALLVGCNNNRLTPDPGSEEKQAELSEKALVSILTESHYAPNEFAEALGAPSMTALLEEMVPGVLPWAQALMKAKVLSHLPALDRQFAKECGTSLLDKRCWEIQSYTFSYRSFTADGREQVLSGRVTFPRSKEDGIAHQVQSLSLHIHQALLSPDCAPSENLMYMPLQALWDTAVIEPDLQVWGITHGAESDGAECAIGTARQLADCTVAALEVMRQHGVTLSPDGYTTNWGSSQGANATLVFAKWYELEAPQWFKDALRLKSTFAGEGTVAFPSYILSRIIPYPEQFPSMISFIAAYFYPYSHEQLGGYDPDEFFVPWLVERKVQLKDGREVSYMKAASMHLDELPDWDKVQEINTLDQFFAADMLTPDGKLDENSPKTRAWFSCLAKHNDYFAWEPKHPVYMAHSPEDDLVPYDSVEKLYKDISNNGQNPQVHLLSVPAVEGKLINSNLGIHYYTSFVMSINMACAKDPEDMTLLYRPVN